MKLVDYNKQLTRIESQALYSLEAHYEGFDYWLPNDDSHYIIAINHGAKVAVSTGFYEMDDFYEGSDYLVNLTSLTGLV
jgi:hypothetical protein